MFCILMSKTQGLIYNYVEKALKIKEVEVRPALLSFVYFFTLFTGYYMMRPLRDEMGITAGVNKMQWLFTGTFVVIALAVPIFGYVTTRFSRLKFLPAIYLFFILNIAIFFTLFQFEIYNQAIAIAFFIWLSVFNMFVVSIFWSFMTDLFSHKQSKRLFGFIAAGGSAGAICGPLIAAIFVEFLQPTHLLPLSAGILLISTYCINLLCKWKLKETGKVKLSQNGRSFSQPIGGSIWSGLQATFKSRYLGGIGLFIVLYTTVSTFLYFEQAHLIDQASLTSAKRTQLFAGIDLATNVIAISAQLFLTSRVMLKLGLALTLALVPLLVALGFFTLSLTTALPVVIALQIVHRAGNFSLLRPGREILFTSVTMEQRYKAKNFVDTVVYRGGDAVTGWAFAGLLSLGLGLSALAFIAAIISLTWMAAGYGLGKLGLQQNRTHQDVDHGPIISQKVIT